MIYLCSYELIKKKMQANSIGEEENFVTHFSAGILAETLACLIYVPVDVVKERLQVQTILNESDKLSARTGHCNTKSFHYRNSWDALKQIVSKEGLSQGIYKGYGATLASFGPFSALYFVSYEQFKHFAKEVTETSKNEDLPLTALVLSSASAGAIASWITSPLDLAKLRLQIQRGGVTQTNLTYNGMWHCLRHTYTKSGVQGLFRGAGARVLHFAPAMTITMTCYEKCRSFYSKHLS
mmetsp:Transcript_50589/g.50956  ORF Transcript_50589/g.50956 Transcript_50589/m.50956 type:complete len:238 (-) Transcript_50589:99-812(-)